MNTESLRTLSKEDVQNILEHINEKISSMKAANTSIADIEDFAKSEIDDLNRFVKTSKPFNEPIYEKDFVYYKTILKFDEERKIATVADVYLCSGKGCEGILIKTKSETI